ncbi:hypothetical protein [Thiomicrorhabdus indica]|uniref:hypothetical protein n=1 Tax=Thiomicrorhabdus indica TaxID=2267253 RepID=UPI002AA856EA|nr:hypothetical protein [Thiomicrorhabdus indica]
MNKVLSTDVFILALPFDMPEAVQDLYLNELTNFQEVMVIRGVDCFYLWQHLEAFKRVLGSFDYPHLNLMEVV